MKSRFALALPAINLVAWIFLFVTRPPSSYLEVLESSRLESIRSGAFVMALGSGAPYTTLAERPLYNWSEWHGGERDAVKILEVVNLFPLVAACGLTSPLAIPVSPVSVYAVSWMRGVLFLVLATVQWYAIGRAVGVARSGRTD